MRFKDLPNYTHIVHLSRKFHAEWPKYNIHLVNNVHLISNPASISKMVFENIHAAFDFLRNNPELDVSDEFYGHNFPFLTGNYRVPRSHTNIAMDPVLAVAIDPVAIDRRNYMINHVLLEAACDFSSDTTIYQRTDEFTNFILKSKGLQISFVYNSDKYYYFATRTYAEVIDRCNLTKLMIS